MFLEGAAVNSRLFQMLSSERVLAMVIKKTKTFQML